MGVIPWSLRPSLAFSRYVHSPWLRGPAMHDYPGAQFGSNIHFSDPTYRNDIVLLSNEYKEKQVLLETVHHHTVTAGMRTISPMLLQNATVVL